MKRDRYDAEYYRLRRERATAEPEFGEAAPVKAKLKGLSAEIVAQEAVKRAETAKAMTAWSMDTNERMRLREFAAAGVEPPVIEGKPARVSIGLLRMMGWEIINGEWMR
jgi:hypothetical protein